MTKQGTDAPADESWRIKPFDIVVVPFPFTDRNASKRRPALVVSSGRFGQATGHSVMAMITSADQSAWQGDLLISELKPTGLTQPCRVRLKLFTLDHRLVLRTAGTLGQADRQKLHRAWPGLLMPP